MSFSKPYVSDVFAVSLGHVNTPANGPLRLANKRLSGKASPLYLPTRTEEKIIFWYHPYELSTSSLVFFLLPTKKTVQTSDRCQSAKTKKKSKTSRDREIMCSEKKKKTSFLCRCQAVGEGDERVISLQSRIALVDQFADAPRPLTLGMWMDITPLTADGRGISWKRMKKCRVFFGYPQVICFWRWRRHKRQVLVWTYVLF